MIRLFSLDPTVQHLDNRMFLQMSERHDSVISGTAVDLTFVRTFLGGRDSAFVCTNVFAILYDWYVLYLLSTSSADGAQVRHCGHI